MRHLLLPLLSLLCFVGPVWGQDERSPTPVGDTSQILLLYSYGYGGKGIAVFDDGLVDALVEGGIATSHLFFEHLDLERNKADPHYRAQLLDMLRRKYAGRRIDLLITVQQPALTFLLNEGRELAPGAPAITVQAPMPSAAEARSRRIVSQLAKFDIRGTLERALELFPGTQRVLFVSGGSEADRKVAAEAAGIAAAWMGKLEFEYTAELTLEAMLKRVATLPPRSIIIFTQFNRDVRGKVTVAYEVERMVVKSANAPVFGLYDFNLRNGGIGGSVIGVRKLGESTGRLALDIISGKRPVSGVSSAQLDEIPMFDWGQIKRWGGDVSRLPGSTVFVNRVPTFWEQYRFYVIGLVLFILVQSLLITGLLVARRRRMLAESSLRESEERMRNFFEYVPVGIFVSTRAGKFIYANPALAAMLGYESAAELMAVVNRSSIAEVLYVEPSLRQEIVQKLDQQHWHSAENRYRCKDGRIIDAILSVGEQFDSGSGEFRLYGIVADITERKQIETEIRRLNTELEERVHQRTAELEVLNQSLVAARDAAESANLAKSIFLANMSHEIRTPMHGILGMAGILRRGGVTPKQAERLDKIDTAAQHLLGVLNDILDISKIEAGKFVLEEAPIVIGTLLGNVGSMLSERAKAKGITLQIENVNLPADLVGDPVRVQQALLNYANNAIKFCKTGLVILRTLKQEESTDSVLVRFEVQDTGIGIPPEALPRLFSIFEQADNSMTRTYGGTGLGLAITRRLAELMGGEVGVDTKLGVGSTFWFTARFRKAAPAAQEMTAMSAASAEAILLRDYRDKRLLLVEDDVDNREITVMQLHDVWRSIDVAEDGVDAVELVRKNRYDLILMDMQMPRMDGLEATRQIRKLPNGARVPILAMTANVFSEHRAQCLEAGMNDFIGKAVDFDAPFATLLKWLEQTRD